MANSLFPSSPISNATEALLGLKNRSNDVFAKHLALVQDVHRFAWANPQGLTPQQALMVQHQASLMISASAQQAYAVMEAAATYLNAVCPGVVNASVPSNWNLAWNPDGSPAVTAVPPTATTITLTPAAATVSTGSVTAFAALVSDQFGQPMSPQPAVTWSVTSGTGGIDTSGNFTAPATAETAVVTATSGSLAATANITVTVPVTPPTPIQG